MYSRSSCRRGQLFEIGLSKQPIIQDHFVEAASHLYIYIYIYVYIYIYILYIGVGRRRGGCRVDVIITY